MQKTKLPLAKLIPNDDNPRYIREEKFEELCQSIRDFPEMAQAKEIVVNQDYKILGGNMRYRAMLHEGWTEANVVVVDWTPEKQDEFIIKDNTHSGEWDYGKLAQKWTVEEAKNWGIDTGVWDLDSSAPDYTTSSKQTLSKMVTCPYCGHENERVSV